MGGLIFLALLASGVLVWGQLSGRLTIFGDAFSSEIGQKPLVLASQAVQVTTVTESFDSLRAFDPVTTADWNIESGELSLPYGATEGLGQSGQVAEVRGKSVWVGLQAIEDRPTGSAIYYAVSADGGATWQPVSVLRPAVFTPSTQPDWRWRAYLVRGVASRPPAVQELSLTFYVQK